MTKFNYNIFFNYCIIFIGIILYIFAIKNFIIQYYVFAVINIIVGSLVIFDGVRNIKNKGG